MPTWFCVVELDLELESQEVASSDAMEESVDRTFITELPWETSLYFCWLPFPSAPSSLVVLGSWDFLIYSNYI